MARANGLGGWLRRLGSAVGQRLHYALPAYALSRLIRVSYRAGEGARGGGRPRDAGLQVEPRF